MPQINVLPKEIADLIAAGEVVERPSSVMKELIENAIDAKASIITAEIAVGGKAYMRITDNGCGISRADIAKAFLSHATSKIASKDDLDHIYTLGFRGEALASVAAVAKVEVLTRTEEESVGTRYCIECGEEKLVDDAGSPCGTTIIVRDLFINVPARMKFLKKDVQEGNYIASVLEHAALSHPEISFRFIRDGRSGFSTPGDGNLSSAIYAVYGKEFLSQLIPLKYENGGIRVEGFICHPHFGKSSRTQQLFFVNDRFVKSPILLTALEAAYKNAMLVGKFPTCVLFVSLPYSAVDVNVHPAKTEVRFVDEKKVFDSVYSASRAALSADTERPQAAFSMAKAFVAPAESGEQMAFRQENTAFRVKEYGSPVTGSETVLHAPAEEEKTLDFLAGEYTLPKEKSFRLNFDSPPTVTYEESAAEKKDAEKKIVEPCAPIEEYRVIGEAFRTYIIVESGEKLLLIDKHAAHERILFEKFRAQADGGNAQFLLQPAVVVLSPDEHAAVLENADLLQKAGYDFTDFGDRSVKLSACPAELTEEDPASLVTEIAGYLAANVRTLMPEKLDWIYHSAACRAAVKAGNITTPYELELFAREVLSNKNLRYCPHGRPVVVEVPRQEFEKQFRRIV